MSVLPSKTYLEEIKKRVAKLKVKKIPEPPKEIKEIKKRLEVKPKPKPPEELEEIKKRVKLAESKPKPKPKPPKPLPEVKEEKPKKKRKSSSSGRKGWNLQPIIPPKRKPKPKPKPKYVKVFPVFSIPMPIIPPKWDEVWMIPEEEFNPEDFLSLWTTARNRKKRKKKRKKR